MSYQSERDRFIARMTTEGLDLDTTTRLLRAATTMQRYAELACSSEAADRDRVPCPASPVDLKGRPRKPSGVCLCDQSVSPNGTEPCEACGQRPCLESCGACDYGEHQDIPRITLQDARLEARIRAAMPAQWRIDTQGDPRGYVLRVVPPSFAERNQGRDRFNLDTIGVPSGPTGLRF